jgi:predicted amidophosphoribosyltransferase
VVAVPFDQHGDLMWFSYLDSWGRVTGERHALAIGWRLTDRDDDPWTSRFNAAKYRHHPRAALAAAATLATAIAKVKFVDASDIVIVGAISSGSEGLGKTDLVWQLGEAVAAAVGGRWVPDGLTKKKHKSLHTIRNASDRALEVSGKYTGTRTDYGKTVIVVDDFFTRGDTLEDVSRAIRTAAKEVPSIYAAALGKTERAAYGPNAGISNDHVPVRLAELWDGVLAGAS